MKLFILRLRGFDRRINGHNSQLHSTEFLVRLYTDPINKSFVVRLAAKFWGIALPLQATNSNPRDGIFERDFATSRLRADSINKLRAP
jgi:hypothetical protein